MKRIGFIMTLFLIVSCFSMKLNAQANLDALTKKCDTMPSVNIEVVRQRNDQTKELQPKVITYKINGNSELVDEFLATFKKDESQAIQVIEGKKEGGKILSLLYQFEKVSYFISYGAKKDWAKIDVMY